MTKIRRFRADYIKSDEGTGIGITEHDPSFKTNWNAGTIGIHSIYSDKNLSNRDASIIIFQRIYNDLKLDEHAILQMNKFSYRKAWDKPYRDKLNIFHIETFRGRTYQSMLLARDALERCSDISETFDNPMEFSVIKQVKEGGGLIKINLSNNTKA